MKNRIAVPALALLASALVYCLLGDGKARVVPYTPDTDIDCQANQKVVADIVNYRYKSKNISEMHDVLMRNGYLLRNIFKNTYIYKRLYISKMCLFSRENIYFYLGYGDLLFVKFDKDGVTPRAYGELGD
jgi:hypothetical protein